MTNKNLILKLYILELITIYSDVPDVITILFLDIENNLHFDSNY